MAAKRSIALRLEKANLIARLELQRANIAESWMEATQPLQTLDRGLQAFVRHRWIAGALGLVGGLALLIPGNFWLLRKTLKLAAVAVPYLIAHRKSGLISLILDWLKRRLASAF